ncbi:hypothetical protein B0A55_07338 [Friedmanniomyces simplex]|uniref:ribonuclease Z n=1 Tax=Friedmanniomyces simplex TaxID=329884 RepID=A0A4U0X840_9PEZI|nr:hypothetical protein B0A55_07338 [Friedmanniomyces simplex]
MSNKPVFVATHPRACSTAFERVFMTRRKSLQTIHEPFGDAFYYGPERMGSRFEGDEEARAKSGFSDSTFKTILDRIDREAAEGKRVFIKDITYYLVPPEHQDARVAPSLQRVKRGVGTEEELNEAGGLGLCLQRTLSTRDSGVAMNGNGNGNVNGHASSPDHSPPKSPPFPYDTPAEPSNPTVVPREILERFHFTFLIRHPKFAVPSYYRCCIPPLVERTGFNPFMPSEAGYDELRALFDYCKETGLVGPRVCGREEANNVPYGKDSGIEICVIDADDLLDDPEGILRKYCGSIGLEFREEMLKWDNEEDHVYAKEAFEKWNGFHDDAIYSKDLKPRAHKKQPKTDEEMYAEWVEKYGEVAAKTIKQTVDDNIGTYEYLKHAPNRIVSAVQSLLSGHPTKKQPTETPTVQPVTAEWDTKISNYVPRESPKDRWRKRHILGTRTNDEGADESKTNLHSGVASGPETIFHESRIAKLSPPGQDVFKKQRKLHHVKYESMRSWVQVLTTPTADTPGTTLLLHFDNKRYLVGSLAEGTQRACVQMGARLLKVSECFITGRTEWRNTGGLIGMILTLADAASSSAAAGAEEAKKRALAKGKRLGCLENVERMQQFEEEAKRDASNKLSLFSAPNLNYTLATARRFVFRKGMPVDVHEIEEGRERVEGEEKWAPYWADENVKVWAMSILPRSEASSTASAPPASLLTGTVSPRKRSIDEVYERSEPNANGNTMVTASGLTPAERDQLTVKAVVGEMFDSSWRLDTLHETPLSQVKLPATMFVRDSSTNKLERYSGPLPGQPLKPGQSPLDPSMTVLVRKPWPGALVESLPPTKPRKEAVSYIIRNHVQRGKFHPERAVQLKVEKGFKWNQLSSGNSVQNQDGDTITPDMVLGESKEGGGLAVVDLPDLDYLGPLLARPEWREPKVMAGVGAVVWICGPGVSDDTRLRDFMSEYEHLEHIVSSPEYCPNNIALDSAAAATVRLRQVDPARYTVPIHQNETPASMPPLPKNARAAQRGQMIQLEPKIEVQDKQGVPGLDIAATESETSQEILQLAGEAQESIQAAETQHWTSSLPEDASQAEIVTLGTGSALPSKYRNVSATLLRVPGWGSMLFDAGENTLGQLKRVLPADELKEVLRELRIIWISHMHADHHLGTVGVIRAWYEEVHGARPLPAGAEPKTSFDTTNSLAVVSEPAMMSWLAEYSNVEDYGYSRIAPLNLSVATAARGTKSRLGWFVPPSVLAAQGSAQGRMETLAANAAPPSVLNLQDIQCVAVQHCHGARAVSITFPFGFKASYSGDCRPSQAFSQIGKGSTVCIHEATFDDELRGDAQAKNHSTTSEALGVAQAMGAKACVLTHFSQRYQKLPVLDHGAGGVEAGNGIAVPGDTGAAETATVEESADLEDMPEGPLEDAAASLPDQVSAGEGQQVSIPSSKHANGTLARSSSGPEAVKFRIASDMKVCVAFDYMRVRVGEIPQLEKFTPALLKLFEEEEKPEVMNVEPANGKKAGKNKKQKGQRGNN